VSTFDDIKDTSNLLTNPEDIENLGPEDIRESIHNMNKRSHQGVIEMIYAFARSIEAKDHYTGEHVEQCAVIAERIAEALKFDSRTVENIKHAAVLHDLGKIGIEKEILSKPGKLNDEEWASVKQHPRIGADILSGIHLLKDVVPLVLYHHEHFDGSGYPEGLQGDQIPIGARIIAIADSYQALISNRPYRQKVYSPKEAVDIIQQEAGRKFDPFVAKALTKIASESFTS
jgi:HD-GYP domain-containing protein (c-di-GMP phosphodiesterase class II)